jgi:hypothetical protein
MVACFAASAPYISDSDFRDLLVLLFPDLEAPYAVLTVYADESKSGEKIPVVAVGGALGTGKEWANLLHAWRVAMATEPSVEVFHTSEFETPEGRIGTVYENWSDQRLKDFQNAMLKAKKENVLSMATAATVSVAEFDRVVSQERQRRFGDIYFFCAFHLIHQVAVYAEKFFPQQRVTYYFEEGGPHQDRLRRSYATIADDDKAKNYFKLWTAPTFAPKDSQPGLQIADKLVYEAAKHASHFLDDNPPEQWAVTSRETGKKIWHDRYPVKELIQSDWDVHYRMYDEPDIEDFYKTMEEP